MSTNERPLSAVTRVRCAAAGVTGAGGEERAGGELWRLPRELNAQDDATSGDATAALMLRLVGRLVCDIPVARRQSIGIVLGTTTGCLAADWEFDRSRRDAGGRYASPAAFSRTLPSTAAAEVSVKLKLAGPMLTVSAGDASTALALRRAASWRRHLPEMTFCIAGGFEQQGDHMRAAAVLLGEGGIGGMKITSPVMADLRSPTDRSLEGLIHWVREGRSMDLPGVSLQW